MPQPRILAFAGSLRRESYNKRLVRIAAAGAEAAGAEVTTIDLRDFSLPVFDEDLELHSSRYGCGRPVQDVLPMPVVESAGTIVVDWTLCEAHGLCTSVLPEVISLEADGFPSAGVMQVPPQLLQQAARAVDRCPALALRIQ